MGSLATPFQSGLNKPPGAVNRSSTQCGDITGTPSACWEQARHVTLQLAKEPSLMVGVSRRKGHGHSMADGPGLCSGTFWVQDTLYLQRDKKVPENTCPQSGLERG